MTIPTLLYDQIIRTMPIPCVDVIVYTENNRVLLIKRKNPPASEEWWFPGGRILHGEVRSEAVKRKVKEECGLDIFDIEEIKTYDLLLPIPGKKFISHGISTIFRVKADMEHKITLDNQSTEWDDRIISQWLKLNLHPFISDRLREELILQSNL